MFGAKFLCCAQGLLLPSAQRLLFMEFRGFFVVLGIEPSSVTGLLASSLKKPWLISLHPQLAFYLVLHKDFARRG